MNFFYRGMDELEDVCAVQVFAVQPRKEKGHLERMMYDGIQAVSGAALATCTWNGNFHPMWPITFYAMTIEGVLLFMKDAQCYLYGLPIKRRRRVCTRVYFSIRTLTCIASVHAFSNSLKQDDSSWIPWLGFAATAFRVCEISSFELKELAPHNTGVWRVISNLKMQLFGPALILGTFYYLVIVEKHDKQWLVCLPLLASVVAGKNMLKIGYFKEVRIDDLTCAIHKVLEHMIGGFAVFISSSVLFVYSVNNNFHPLLVILFFVWVLAGRKSMRLSLDGFQAFTRMEEPLLFYILRMDDLPIVLSFLSIGVQHECLIVKYVCTTITGINFLYAAAANRRLSKILPRPLYANYCQRTLAPTMAAYSSLASVYVGYRMGWQYSLVMIPLISAGIYYTYRGYST